MAAWCIRGWARAGVVVIHKHDAQVHDHLQECRCMWVSEAPAAWQLPHQLCQRVQEG